jgi:hypothetical protein
VALLNGSVKRWLFGRIGQRLATSTGEQVDHNELTLGALCLLSQDHTSGGSPGQIFFDPFLKKRNFHPAKVRGSPGEIFLLKSCDISTILLQPGYTLTS